MRVLQHIVCDKCADDDCDGQHLDYDALACAYRDALARIEILEEYAMRMLSICAALRKVKP